jgi:hypothetical protein
LGWVDGKEVWRRDGTYLGEIVSNNYILRRTSMATKARKAAKATPAMPASPARKANRAGKAQKEGYIDALDEYK